MGALLLLSTAAFAQKPKDKTSKSAKEKARPVSVAEDFTRDFTVRGGLRHEIAVPTPEQDSLKAISIGKIIDSLVSARKEVPSADSVRLAALQIDIDSLTAERARLLPASVADSLAQSAEDSLQVNSSRLKPRYNAIFRDSVSFPLVTAISVVVPGFAQFYEQKYWKIPIQYAAIAAPLYFGIKQNTIYQDYKSQYDDLVAHGATQAEKTPVQTKMIRHNTYRQLLFGAAAAAYVGFLVDGVTNYPSELSRIQKATTLSMVCPGAGQIYNGSYWKLPIVVGGIASMIYVIDWNTRGYNRFKLAYDLRTDGDDTTVDEFTGTSEETLRTYKNLYRRNRDLSIIGLIGVYLVQVADAHIDAHMKVYDISDSLALNVTPRVLYSLRPDGRATNNFGFNFSFYF